MSYQSKWWHYVTAIIDTIFFFDPDHCLQSYESEKKRLQTAPEYR